MKVFALSCAAWLSACCAIVAASLCVAMLSGCAEGLGALPQCVTVCPLTGGPCFLVCASDGSASGGVLRDAGQDAEASTQAPPVGSEASADITEDRRIVTDATVDALDVSRDAAGDARETAADALDARGDEAAAIVPTVPDAGAVARPAGNTGIGFFVASGKLYDANGVEFRPTGLNKLHWDAPSPGLFGANPTKSNAVRWVIDFDQPTSTNLALMQKSIAAKQVPIPGSWNGTCDESTATLSSIVDQWVAQAATWKSVERFALFNIANEWGPPNSIVWRDSYVTAIARMRAAGYLGTLVVDAGGCGQDVPDLVNYAQAVFASDPQRNVVFDWHVYGFACTVGCQSWQFPLAASLDAMKTTGLPMLCGEYGPGRNIGPSPTNITPGEVMQACATRGFGTLAWAFDDPAGEFTSGGCADDGFCIGRTGDYASTTDLTTYGKSVIEDPVFGIRATARPATVF